MMRMATLVMVLAAGALGGCASSGGTKGVCNGNSVCPIVIYEKFPGVFATFPDYVTAAAMGTTTLLWTFADQTRYKFMAKSNTGRPDTVELIGGNGVKDGLAPCFITADSNLPLSPQSEGSYLRCEITLGSKFKLGYRIHFHGSDGVTAYTVDPTVETTGSNDGGGPRAADRRTTVVVAVGKDATVPATADSVRVVWDAGGSNVFELGGGVVFEYAGGYEPPCYVASDNTGQSISMTPSRYFACVLFGPPALNYIATYRDSILGVQTAKGKIVPQ